MPSILQGRNKPPAAPAPPEPMPDANMPMPPAGGSDTPGQLVASIYEKPDGTYCTEDATGQQMDHPDANSALEQLTQTLMGGDMTESSGMEPDSGGGDKAPAAMATDY